jgi:hypothetical protein
MPAACRKAMPSTNLAEANAAGGAEASTLFELLVHPVRACVKEVGDAKGSLESLGDYGAVECARVHGV